MDPRFHRSLRVSYPDATDRAEARKRGCSPGGDIFIHGLGKEFAFLGKLHRASDWTLGCVAVTNEEIEEIWAAVDVGTVGRSGRSHYAKVKASDRYHGSHARTQG